MGRSGIFLRGRLKRGDLVVGRFGLRGGVVFASGSAILGTAVAVRHKMRRERLGRGVALEPASFDFEEVRQDKTVSHSFELRSDWRVPSAFVLLMVFLVGGCRGERTAVEQRDVELGRQLGRETIELEYDFGLVRPGERVRHSFHIRNTTALVWRLRKFHADCACALASSSARVFQPGRTEAVEVEYHAGNRTADSRGTVLVEFEDPRAPIVRLGVRAQVRKRMTLSDQELLIENVGQGLGAERHIQVANFGEKDWKAPAVRTSADWLSATVNLVSDDPAPDDREPWLRQVWDLRVTLEPQSLSPGSYHETVELEVDGSPGLRTVIPAHICVAPLVKAVPERLFVGVVAPGARVTRKISLEFQGDVLPDDDGAIHVEHDLGSDLAVSVSRGSPTSWDLTATLTTTGEDDFVEDLLRVTFVDQRLPELKIPIDAYIRKP